MNYQGKTKDELILELQKLQHGYDSYKKSYLKEITNNEFLKTALEESESRFRLLFENSMDAVLLTGPDGTVYTANPAARMMFGRTESEICGLGRDGVVDQTDPRLKQRLKEWRKKGKVFGELTLLRKDGSKFPAEVSSAVFSDSQGRQLTSMIIRDISERKSAEKELHLRSEIMKNITEGISLARLDDGVIVFTNAKFDEMFCYEHGELIGKQISILDAPTDKSPVKTKQDITDTINRTGEWHGEILNIKKNGDYFRCYINVSVLSHSDYGKVYLSVYSDITERKETETALRESEARFRSLFDNSLVGISAAGKDGRLIYSNLAYARMYGYENPEIMLSEVPNVAKLYSHPEVRKEIKRTLRKFGKMKEKEFEVVRRDGSRFLVLVAANEVRDADGKLLYNQATHIDLTERLKLEEELRNSKELLEKLNQHLNDIRENERTVISREIHDELGQSMTALKLDLNQMHKYVINNPEAVMKLGNMIGLVSNTIKEVQRISSDLRPGILDDLGLVSAIEWYCDEFEKRTGIKCILKLDTSDYNNAPINLVFFRVLQETLTNVIRHSMAHSVKIKFNKSEKGITMTIYDNGIGIPEEKIESHKSLGLITMRERVRQFGGKIVISSLKGKGTKLYIFIPELINSSL